MTAFPLPGRTAKGALHWLSAALVFATFAAQAPAQEPIRVALDQATIMKLPERAATVVIGDPLIADLSLQPGGIAVVTGKGYGATNVVVMDRGGAVLLEKNVVVAGPPDHVVFVYRGAVRNTYSCTPECSPRITLGDDYDYFDKTMGQSASRNTQAIAAGASASH
jgi:hypothetical protein